ncbi:hypothetical protein [Pseudomonas sp. TWI628]|uniref:hypothetical protein n=1 Tax=Pseudomonas sp. TWI628 TaxID=3136788 RepID=UPI00320791BC
MSKLHQANDEKPGVPSGRQGDKQEESKSHDLVREPSFPLGSIGTGKAWQFKGDYEQPSAAYPYVALYPEAQLWQDIVLPVAANPVDDARPDYWVGWEYDTGSLTDCTLTVHDFSEGKEGALLDTVVMEGVKATPPAHGLPPVPKPENVNWTTRDLQRIKGLHSGITAIRIKFEAGDGRSYLNLRNTDLDVRLPELKAKVTLVVDPDGLKIEQAAAPYQFCHGAEHRLEVSGDEAGSWLDQPVALSWHEDKLPIELALQATPPFQRGDVDGDSFQNTLSATKTAWTITSSADATTASVPLSLGLKSWWQAAIGKHDANVGDYVYGLSKIEGGDIALVIDDQNANSATLTTYISNFFVPGRNIKGAQVQWLLNGVPFATEPSDERGQVLVKYTAQKGDEGTGNEAEITAICTSLEGYSSEKNQKIRVFASSPWADEVEVWLNGKPVDLKDLGLHLKLGSGSNKLLLKPKGDYFIGKAITLRSQEESAEKLGIDFAPKEAMVMPAEGLEWTISSGEGRGSFVLDAFAAGLNVPFSLKGGQTSANLADEVDFKVAGIIAQKPPLFWRGKPQVFSMVPKPGSPLERMPALKATLTFVDGSVAKPHMSADPEFGAENARMGGAWSWSLTGGAVSGTFGLSVSLEGFGEPVSLAKAVLLSTKLDDEMELIVGGQSP